MPPENSPAVYLTFDDGPHPTVTPFVLDLLQKYDARATFFCVGDNVAKYPGVYAETLTQGHATANHTYNHLNGWKTANDTYMDNIEQAGRLIRSALFRPPYGKIKRAQARHLWSERAGWKIIMWSVLSADFDRKISAEQCLDNVLRNIRPGSIILFHDSEKAWDRMSYALPHVLAHCKEKGWAMKAITNG